jgi:hypothetical protein
VGWHRISVEDLQVYNLPRNDDGSSVEEIKRVLRVPAGYAHANQTPLHEEVRSGTQHLKVELPAPQ